MSGETSVVLRPSEVAPARDRFDFADPPRDPVDLAHELCRVVIAHGFFSLAANQIGLPYRVIAIRCQPMIVAFNPRVLAEGEDTVVMEEGCPGFPFTLEVPRPTTIRVRYTMPNGETTSERFTGLTARYFLQSVEMLDGTRFTSHVSRYHVDKAKKRARKLS